MNKKYFKVYYVLYFFNVNNVIFYNKMKYYYIFKFVFKLFGCYFDFYLIVKVRQFLYEILIYMYMFVKYDKFLSN